MSISNQILGSMMEESKDLTVQQLKTVTAELMQSIKDLKDRIRQQQENVQVKNFCFTKIFLN